MTDEQDAYILQELDDQGILTITLNRPAKKNAMSLAMWRALGEIFAKAGENSAVRGVVLTGAGGSFCTGADISEFDTVRATAEQGIEYDRINDETVLAIRNCPRPVCAAISGYAVGGGLSLALACDFRVAGKDAKMGIPAGRLGLVYSILDCRILTERIGTTASKRILFEGDIFGCERACELGLVDQLTDGEAVATARAWLGALAANAPLSQAGNKAILNALADGSVETRKAELEDLIKAAFDSEDYLEGRRAFAERRPARFVGF
ncbi:Enoyl-CoA hydratase/carnithine racemase [Roseovarius pacificus]|uniref:Enoyl-CoA hydratase/carnithine racemase n=1 Tax=Roseovarius pacificus TaxID=337701 RepID=A0A1M7AC25_9RHOB|nr:enoyl-CoA hydratase-related protein [Roseovarius pacificus]GGO53630.1 3-hydroxybutyryl-CoA dehydratase [Roseovarius pacificus]SHL40293.1 Enoyl-CoA hydratase/carnithine racemase [Roseovarius pacificus]